MIAYIPWHDGIYLDTVVQEGDATFPIYLYFSYVLNPIGLLKRVWIQEGSLQSGFYASSASFLGLFMAFIVVIGVKAPFINADPFFSFNCFLSLVGFHKQAITDEMFRAAAMVTVFLICLGIFCHSGQSDHEFFCHPLKSTRIITLWIFTIISILFF